MKLHNGSIQRKRLWYYLVLSFKGRQRWIALKTTDLHTARIRAARLAPRSNDPATYLRHLIRLGEKARLALHQVPQNKSAAPGNLWENFLAQTNDTLPAASLPSYKRWCTILTSEMKTRQIPCPNDLTEEDAKQIAADLAERYLSAARMVVFFRRVWKCLGLADSIWPRSLPSEKEHESYRRLKQEEICRVIEFLRRHSHSPSAADFADMVLIGYYTGLRLSDVAELEREEIREDINFLVLQPNKVRHSKKRLLMIPLVGQAKACVLKRLLAMAPEEEFLFSAAARRRPTKQITAAFRACGLFKEKARRCSFHSLRATFISLMDEAGISPHLTDAITGHAGGGMHARYSQPSPAALFAAVERAIPPLIPQQIRKELEHAAAEIQGPSAEKSAAELERELEQVKKAQSNKAWGADMVSGPRVQPGKMKVDSWM